jgi:DNA-directed RNA polymerase specialized sigma24 family protein
VTFDFGNSTIMSVLFGVAHAEHAQRRLQLERFAIQYTRPLVTFLCRTKRIPEEQAEEIVQDFWFAKLIQPAPDQNIAAKYLEKVVEKSPVPSGSFRKFLMRAISNHFIDRMRKNKNAPASLDAMAGFDAVTEQDCQTFDAAWANSILHACIKAVHQECLDNRQLPMWHLFCSQIVVPKLSGTSSPGYAMLAKKFKFSDAGTAANAVRTVIRKFQSHLKTQVLDYLPVALTDESNRIVEQECNDILELLSKPNALDSTLFADVIDWAELKLPNASESFCIAFDVEDRPFLDDPSRSFYSTDEDFRFRWQQLLVTPIAEWLASHSETCPASEHAKFIDLVMGERLPIEVPTAVRNTAKRLARQEQDEPQVILAALYLASIASAHRNHGKLLTSDPLEKVLGRIEQILKLVWLDDGTRESLLRFLSTIRF